MPGEPDTLRYVVLHHTGVPAPHYDVLIEPSPGDQLAAWRSSTWPVKGPTIVERINDHRRIYLEYEGDISGGRGQVKRVAGGACHVDVHRDGTWTVTLLSGGTLVLRPAANSAWTLEAE